MAVSLDNLDGDFRTKAEALLADLNKRGIEMRPCAAVRTAKEQAALWRQSRSKEEIDAAIAKLRTQGGSYLADTLASAGPQHGPHVTNALPGYSWHQWGEAIDCFWVVNGGAVWEETKIVNGVNGYKVYAASAKTFDVYAGGNWTGFKDWPHIQKRKEASPVVAGLTVKQVNDAMEKRYG